jgi:hypothetical protein
MIDAPVNAQGYMSRTLISGATTCNDASSLVWQWRAFDRCYITNVGTSSMFLVDETTGIPYENRYSSNDMCQSTASRRDPVGSFF